MPIGPNGEKRPSDVVGNAVMVARIATGEGEDESVDRNKRRGGLARSRSMTPERRSEIAKLAAAARWDSATETSQ